MMELYLHSTISLHGVVLNQASMRKEINILTFTYQTHSSGIHVTTVGFVNICACVCVRACVWVCVCVCVWERERERESEWVSESDRQQRRPDEL
jgi:hypothetical protein